MTRRRRAGGAAGTSDVAVEKAQDKDGRGVQGGVQEGPRWTELTGRGTRRGRCGGRRGG